MSKFVMSDKYPEFNKAMSDMGHIIIPSDTIELLPAPEQKHADMQIMNINGNIIVLKECQQLIEKLNDRHIIKCAKKIEDRYPDNIILNFLHLNHKLYGKSKYIDYSLKEYCTKNNIEIVNINQGYCRCSTLVIDDNAVITSDSSIEKILKNDGVEVLKILPGHIRLEGYNYGFIGGASGKIDNDTIVFFGNIKLHPSYNNIKNFCNKYDKKIIIIREDCILTDIGGIVKVE